MNFVTSVSIDAQNWVRSHFGDKAQPRSPEGPGWGTTHNRRSESHGEFRLHVLSVGSFELPLLRVAVTLSPSMIKLTSNLKAAFTTARGHPSEGTIEAGHLVDSLRLAPE